MDEKPEPRFKYTPEHPQAPMSPMLAEYMRNNNIDKAMSVEDARKWFDGLRDALKTKTGRQA